METVEKSDGARPAAREALAPGFQVDSCACAILDRRLAVKTLRSERPAPCREERQTRFHHVHRDGKETGQLDRPLRDVLPLLLRLRIRREVDVLFRVRSICPLSAFFTQCQVRCARMIPLCSAEAFSETYIAARPPSVTSAP